MLNPVWLDTFCTLVETGHFTLTAEKKFMTQPGVSQHIKKLERACGYVLLERDNKQFLLTEAGRKLYRYACKLQDEEKRLLDELGEDSPYAGQCRLACSGALATRLYPALLGLQQMHQDLIIHLEAAPHGRILEAIQSGQTDIGIVTQPPAATHFAIQALGKEHLCLVLPPTMANTPVTPQRLTELGLIRHPDVLHYLGLFLYDCGDEAIASIRPDKLKTKGYVNQIGQILLPVQQGFGFTVLPFSAVESAKVANKVYVPSFPKDVVEPLYLISQHRRALPQRFNTIVDKLRELAS
ncbi:LysR family transcriptional regulator [Alteromonas sp. C1M14]|uniref:LysR family transcriptional regulator n=1 Tax=Alteromonas sp. C1M14 TaxID=2841567 RepID=UPI001C09D888|nr:LysR family transcriptional regulator [Alteromonas sp. C1M14]MBU2978335.1 LysR family transcriptional regulator [Alteromonas sp. C1M14]